MVNGNKQQSLFSNPLVLFLVGMGVVLIAVVLAVMVLQPGGQLKTAIYSFAPVADRCVCYCLGFEDLDGSQEGLCPKKLDDNGMCKDDMYEYMDITDQKACENKNRVSCIGYGSDGDGNLPMRGTLDGCEIISVAVSPTPTSSVAVSPTPTSSSSSD